MGKLERISFSYDEVIQELKISKATLRNWIKLGHLKKCGKKQIEASSFATLKTDLIGNNKLVARANKLHVHDETSGAKQIILFDELIKMPLEEVEKLSAQHENLMPESLRNEMGVFYTPNFIIDAMFTHLHYLQPNHTFLDPCCGTGNFFIGALEKGFLPQNLYGFDIDRQAIEFAKARIYKRTGFVCENIKAHDFLDDDNQIEFDYIFTNPPWGKKLDAKKRKKLNSRFGFDTRVDNSAIFTVAILEKLKPDGLCGLLVQEAFFNIASFTPIREKILKHNIINISDYGRAFDGLLTSAQAIIIKKEKADAVIECEFENEKFIRQQYEFEHNPNKIFNYYTKTEEAKTIDSLFLQPHKKLENNARWALGLVTGDNKKHVFKQNQTGAVPIYRGADINENGIRETNEWIIPEFDKFQQVAPLEFYRAPEKIIYRFITPKPIFGFDDRQRLFLNSANILIPSPNLGIGMHELCKLMNGQLFSWMFKHIFKTPKVLRQDLEAMPLFIEQFKAAGFQENDDFYQSLGINKSIIGL